MMSKKSPQLRFEGFTDDWEQRKLGSLTTVVRGASPRPIQDPKWFDKESDIGWLRIADVTEQNGRIYHLEQHISKLGQEKTRVLTEPHLLLSIAATVGKPVVNYVKTGVHDGFLIFLNPTFEREFMFQWLEMFRPKWQKYGQPGSQVNLNSELVRNQEIVLPNYKEQQKIGSFFKQLDETIALHQRKLDLLKEQKKGYLQKMFPKNGAKVPELRFAGFADDWEERKLGEFSDVRDGTHASPKYVSQGHPMVTSKNLTHSGLDMTDVSFLTDKDFNEINKRSKVSIGDILFGMIGTIGNPVIVDRDDFAIKNVALIKEKTSNPITNKWLLQYLKSPSFNRFIQKENAGGTQKFIALGLIRDMKLRVPEFDEQQKIGQFFKQLDDTITLHQRKLDLLKEQKKGFLQKMFV
ncbi:restriction endonuclease subunit S [Lactococcus petauri]|uniref:restriction endonuclease subunit S n=1 Tax=Lactococcus petauri TaxID=1940789 RepID=UPI0022E5439D|nr:restriction endonuclease subunit S [Lactococcus petauri]